ncbi:MAG: hypothetical protein HY899_00915, partial [Deltaproteobacteria bacterium]|nr:hypothetical protein [Deltaproteobacteria bacterium]
MQPNRPQPSTARCTALGAAIALALLAAPPLARAQSAIIYGSVSNFDISNDTGRICHGFEIDLDGETTPLLPSDSFTTERYGAPTSFAYPGGVAVRWESPFDPATQSFTERTLPHTVAWFPGQCYQWNPATYQNSGCEHFGTARSGTSNITSVTARWLCQDSADPTALVPVDPPTAVAFPNYSVQQPARAGNPPQVVMEVDAPEPAEAPELYGDAQWMRVFVAELPREVALDELMADNPAVVPMDPAQLESDWDVIQAEPAALAGGKRSRKRNGRDLQPTTRSVVRRIEMYEYTGAYDAATHQALCADLTCTAPSPGELGALVSTQMTAVNVQADSLTVTRTGNGLVESADKRISCGNKCVAPYDAGTLVTLSTKAASGSAFSGWTGACSGTASTCTVAANGHTDVGATFVAAPSGGGGSTSTASLSVKTSGGKGLITSTPAGISCGKTCSVKVVPGTGVTLSVLP